MIGQSSITLTDQFAGCGGSSSGADEALQEMGINDGIKLAMNHWKLAVDTHAHNFPKTLHDCADISASHPRRYPSTTGLVTSPSCTEQSGANGKKKPKKQLDMFNEFVLDEDAERSRATMWDVPRFSEVHKYEFIVVENVEEVRKWINYDSWLHAMKKQGYNHKALFLNSMFFPPCPQSRDRIYIVFWKKGNRKPDLNYKPAAHCSKCSKEVNAVQAFKPAAKKVKYQTGYIYCCPTCMAEVTPYYYAAFNIIDWTNPGTIIGDRLCENTMRRIRYGRDKFWSNASVPLVLKGEYTKNETGYVRSIFDSLYTQSTRQTFGLLTPPPFIVMNKGQSMARSIDEAISSFTSMPFHGICSPDPLKAFLTYYNGGSDQASHILEAAGTFTTADRVAITNYTSPILEECYYRTLKAHEVKAGMAFRRDYTVLGSEKEQVNQLGNAVTPPVMKWIIKQLVKSLM